MIREVAPQPSGPRIGEDDFMNRTWHGLRNNSELGRNPGEQHRGAHTPHTMNCHEQEIQVRGITSVWRSAKDGPAKERDEAEPRTARSAERDNVTATGFHALPVILSGSASATSLEREISSLAT